MGPFLDTYEEKTGPNRPFFSVFWPFVETDAPTQPLNPSVFVPALAAFEAKIEALNFIRFLYFLRQKVKLDE